MEQTNLGQITNSTKLENFSKEELITKYTLLEDELARVIKENYKLRDQQITDEQLKLILSEQMGELQSAMYGTSSERYKKPEKTKTPSTLKPQIKRPSERYPNQTVREVLININPLPACGVCGSVMSDSGMTEDSEQLTVIPKKYEIVLQRRAKYRCTCQGCVLTAPVPPRIIPGSSYSDEMIQDVCLSKYCDLIPMERYSAMAARGGVMDLPPHSLIELTHTFAGFTRGAYDLMKTQVMQARVLHADETPHRMLEGSGKKSWYLGVFQLQPFAFWNVTTPGQVTWQVRS